MNIIDLIDYNPETGRLYWGRCFMAGKHTRIKGQPVTMRSDSDGYLTFRALGKVYKASYVIWEKYHGTKVPDGMIIDHIDGMKWNNKIDNLRIATLSQNQQNAFIRVDNTTGVKCVSYDKKINRYKVRIWANGVRHYLGVYKTLSEAESVAIAFRNEHHKEFAKHA